MELTAVLAKGYWRDADARVVVDAWRSSGLSRARFASEVGCSKKRLDRWAARLKDRSGRAARGDGMVLGVRQSGEDVRFVELVRPAAPAPQIDIAIGRAVVRVPSGFDPNMLRQVVAILAEAPC